MPPKRKSNKGESSRRTQEEPKSHNTLEGSQGVQAGEQNCEICVDEGSGAKVVDNLTNILQQQAKTHEEQIRQMLDMQRVAQEQSRAQAIVPVQYEKPIIRVMIDFVQ